jgi:hypothetical protein
MQMELASALAKNATKPNPFKIIPLQTTRKENNWKTEKKNVDGCSCNSGDRTDQRVQSLMFMMMMMITMIPDFKLSPCFEYCICSFGYFPGVRL